MDVNWFKQQQKITGVTSEALGEALGRDRTIVSRIYHGRQKLSFDQAKVFADLLKQPLAEVIARGGLTDPATAQSLHPGFSEGDAAPWVPGPTEKSVASNKIAEALKTTEAGRDIWRVKSRSMALAGYLEGDYFIVDANLSPRSGDVVVAQAYDWQAGAATTLLRRYDPPALVSASSDPADWKTYVVDDNNVVIKGVVIASWRQAR